MEITINTPFSVADYGSNDHAMTVYYPANSLNPSPPYNPLNYYPGLVLLHHGNWSGGSRADIADICAAIAKQGVVVGAIDYTLATSTNEPSLPKVMTDIEEALYVIGNYACVQGQPVSLGGVSAGAHLALHYCMAQEHDVHAFIGIGTPTDMRLWDTHWASQSVETMTCLLGSGYTAQDVIDASPLLADLADFDTPCVFVQGETDYFYNLVDALQMCDALVAAGKDPTLLRFQYTHHGLTDKNRIAEMAGAVYPSLV